jgi:hypothetical protein
LIVDESENCCIVSGGMILNNVRTFSHGYGAKWTHEGPDVPTPSAFDGIVGSDEYLKHPKIRKFASWWTIVILSNVFRMGMY